MSSLHHDRSSEEDLAPADPVATTAPRARRTTSASGAAAPGRAAADVPSQRQGTAQPAGDPCAAAAVATSATAGTAEKAEPTAAAAGDRPTPYRRRAVGPVSAAPTGEEVWAGPLPATAGPEALLTAATQGRVSRLAGRMRSLRRRPALYLAAVLIGALGISGASAAPTPVTTQTVGQSVSVAEQLGIEPTAPAVAEEDAASLLRGLRTSRNIRDAERAAAAQVQAEADRLAAEEAARVAAEAARPKAVHPVEGARLTSGFGARWGTLHPGVDLAAPMRTPERAVMDGVVLEAGAAAGFGLVVYIQHENGDVTVYGHMDEILVEPGQIVRAGDTIALLGNRGQSTGPHLHFEVHVGGLDGQAVDPLPWLRERGVDI